LNDGNGNDRANLPGNKDYKHIKILTKQDTNKYCYIFSEITKEPWLKEIH